jgi:hypothetical protein
MADPTAHEYALPYSGVPRDRYDAILRPTYDALLQREFSDSAIRREYVFTSEGSGLKVHLAAFTDPERWDPITSGVNFYYNRDNLPHHRVLDQLARTGAPFNLIGGEGSVSLYVVSQDGRLRVHTILQDFAYEQLPQALTEFGADISPQRIRRAKEGSDTFVLFPEFSGLQLRLFAVQVTREILVKQFAAALRQLESALANQGVELEAPALAVELLAAVVLAHKGVLRNECAEQGAPMSLVIDAATRRFSRYFRLAKMKRYRQAAEAAFGILQQVRYSSLTPDILEALYEQAYPEIAARRREGRYNTPLYVTHRILRNIPLETLPPTQRVVADMTCGVGSFLVASYERLRDLTDMGDSGRPLRDHLFGNDRDEFTADLARLSLLLISQKDEWHVDHQDALAWAWLKRNSPSIIVGNPPFRGSRKEGSKTTAVDEETGRRKRSQKADAFLEKAVHALAPGGYLAMLMPQSFVLSQASPSTRRMLLEYCDVLEMWELPSETFPGVTVRPLVVFAQRKGEGNMGRISSLPVRVRTVQPRDLVDFTLRGKFTASGLAPSQEAWGPDSQFGEQTTHVMRYSLILEPREWDRIWRRARQLSDVAQIVSGATIGSQRPWAGYESPKRVGWLPSARKSLPRPYCVRYGDETIVYPNELQWPRKSRRDPSQDNEYLLAGRKVLVASAPDPTWGQRAKVAIERRGFYPSDSFWVVAPRPGVGPEITLEVLAVVVSWYVGNAWVVEHLKETKILSHVLRQLPFPRDLSTSECEVLTSAVRELEKAAGRNAEAPEAQLQIDQVLSRAYRLDAAAMERLRTVAHWDSVHSSGPTCVPDPASLVLVSGGIEEVDAEEGTVTMWLTGFKGFHSTPITDEMPGWMLRPGACFRAHIPEANLRRGDLEDAEWARISAQPYTYLDEERLLNLLSARLRDQGG